MFLAANRGSGHFVEGGFLKSTEVALQRRGQERTAIHWLLCSGSVHSTPSSGLTGPQECRTPN